MMATENSAPLSKFLLGEITPVPMAALLHIHKYEHDHAHTHTPDIHHRHGH